MNPIPLGIRFRDEIFTAAEASGLDPLLLTAVAAQESGGPGSDSGANVMGDNGHGHGLFQIDDRSHASWLASHHDGLDVAENAQYAAQLITANFNLYGSMRAALNAYNSGSPTNPTSITAWPDGQYLNYPDSVFRHLDRLRRRALGSPSPTTAIGKPLLKLGDNGDIVRGVQRLLGIDADGIFGLATESAIIDFQKAHSLAADGVVGPATWGALLDGTLQPVCKVGSTQSPTIARLQRFLGVDADGDFGPVTEQALIAFQRSRQIAPTGVAGPETWTALLLAVADGTEPLSVTVGPADRNQLLTRLDFQPTPTLKSDILDPAKTRQHLIDLLSFIVVHGFRPLITSVNTDHRRDNIPAMGGTFNHGHTNGWAVDLFVVETDAASFIRHCLYDNGFVTKIGLGGPFQSQRVNGIGDHFTAAGDQYVNGKTVFADNETAHIHLQTM